MTEAEALKRFIPILARISTPYERATIVMRVNERINAKDSTHLLGVTYRHIAALAWPSEPARAKQFEDKLTAAVEAGEFVSMIRDGKHLQIEELLAWPDCPSIAPDSPLTFWLGEPVPATDTAPAQTATPAPVVAASDGPAKPTDTVDRGWVMKKAALIKKHERQWSTINGDFQGASENGLSKAAKAPGHGDWFETDALNWARQRGKLSEAIGQQAPSPATPFDGLTHRIKH